MDYMEQQAINLSAKFLEVVGKNTYEWASTKINLAKDKNSKEDQQVAYEAIINNLLQDKMELESVTREYKSLYESITINDNDIEYLQETIQQAVKILNNMSPELEKQKDSIDTFIQLINKDTLKTMQLLGFNYKEAIGIPLTEVCANTIHSKLGVDKQRKNKPKK